MRGEYEAQKFGDDAYFGKARWRGQASLSAVCYGTRLIVIFVEMTVIVLVGVLELSPAPTQSRRRSK
jgi:hypothetical protein